MDKGDMRPSDELLTPTMHQEPLVVSDKAVKLREDISRDPNMAQVQLGKTTMADALLATNGIVSSRQSGKLRYMDNTEGEQERGITMKSSVIGLIFNRKVSSVDKNDEDYYLVNLVDSPGHVDFSSEVSTAVRLCDAATIVVDVVEGVCPQTRTVLRQAWDERLTLLLALNKIDRLVVEIKLTPSQAYETMCRVIEQVNSVLAEMFSADVTRQRDGIWQMNIDKHDLSSDVQRDNNVYDWSDHLEKADDSNLYFSPEKGNVVFCSSVDSWGFRVDQFCQTWSERLSVPYSVLQKSLWGDFYLTSSPTESNKMVIKPNARQKQKKSIFVQLVLEPLWNAYQTLFFEDKRDKVFAMAQKVGVNLDQRVIRNVDSRGVLRAFLSAWLSLGHTLMHAITDICPSPSSAVSADRAVHMLYGDTVLCDSALTKQDTPIPIDQTSRVPINSIYSTTGASLALQSCDSSSLAPTIIFVAKVFWTDKLRLTSNITSNPASINTKQENTDSDGISPSCDTANTDVNNHSSEIQSSIPKQINLRSPLLLCNPFTDTDFIALARVFSGSVYPGQKLFVLGPKFNGRKLLGGQSDFVKLLEPVPSGNIVGLTGPDLIACLPKSGLLVSRLSLVSSFNKANSSETELAPVLPLAGLAVWHGAPVISVAVEPASATNPEDVYRLERGLRLLDRADPCAEVTITANGEYIIRAAGEIHLQKCIEDLIKHFAPEVELQISPFVVPFRETIIDACNTSNSISLISLSNLSYEKAYIQFESLVQKFNLTLNKNCDQLQSLNLQLPSSLCTTGDDELKPTTTTINTGDNLKSISCSTQKLHNFHHNLDINNFPISIFQLPHSKPRTRILIRVTAHPMPCELLNWIEHYGSSKVSQLIRAFKSKLSNICCQLTSKCTSACAINWNQITTSLLAFGPNQTGPNILISHLNTDYFPLCTVWGKKLNSSLNNSTIHLKNINKKSNINLPIISYGKALLRGFQQATLKGPLCAEPMYGIVFVLEEIVAENLDTLKLPNYSNDNTTTTTTTNNNNNNVISRENKSHKSNINNELAAPLPLENLKNSILSSTATTCSTDNKPDNQLLSNKSMTRACIAAFQSCPFQRLMIAVYDLELQARSDVLGRMFGVLRRRYGRVVSEDFREGENTFIISARLPVIESFGLADEIRKRTSGVVSLPQLRPGGWELLDIDPLQKDVSSVDTKESFGEPFRTKGGSSKVFRSKLPISSLHDGGGGGDDGTGENMDEPTSRISRVQRYIREVRLRKGLPLNEQLVLNADKQRTLKKNK
ncbi:similar to elongation factor Tu GTP binding domain containing 1 isoform 6-related [Schistosoma mansoni]|uniref:similar to elongation factor Tu GTP binding domain containing 1 isoform 6-related n=1 Tax=Schistosoma mansoni TaxID=6183 RepID=UPI00022C84E3|nr:similar to elongation factor Tu GTP binding domain containing 1 isoform 6-related [Schistosoma mansoni]|eukprot:XP_018645394.1 similar to elongation factor Tu GTP binding domain containing 1 isoform 6-related [Schistosoma mansoni]